MTHSVSDLARLLECSIAGSELDHRTILSHIAAPVLARPGDLTFWVPGAFSTDHPGYKNAAAVLLEPGGDPPSSLLSKHLVVDNLARACARAVAWLEVRCYEDDVDVAHARSPGEGSVVAPSALVGPAVEIGAFATVGPGAIISGRVRIGNRTRIGAGAMLGADGFAAIRDQGVWIPVPSFGGVAVGDDACIGAQTVVHAGVFSMTSIGAGCMLDSHVLIGHDSAVGGHTAIAGGTVVGGAAIIGRGCRIGGHCAIDEGVRIADEVMVTGGSSVTRNLDSRGVSYSSTWPAQPARAWWRQVARMKRVLGARCGSKRAAVPVDEIS